MKAWNTRMPSSRGSRLLAAGAGAGTQVLWIPKRKLHHVAAPQLR